MGSGRSPAGGVKKAVEFPQAFVENENLSPFKQADQWQDYKKSFGPDVTDEQEKALDGYVATANSFHINKFLYDPNLGYESLSKGDKKTVDTLDEVISTHKTPADAKFTRYVDDSGALALLGLSGKQGNTLMKAIDQYQKTQDPALLDQINKSLVGSTGHSDSFTSTSATKDHLFSHRQFRREISVPSGTNAFAANNDSEHEIIFGRKMNTEVTGISFDGNQVVIHERFVSYGDKK